MNEDPQQTVEFGEPVPLRRINPSVQFDIENLLRSPATWILLGAFLMYMAQKKRL